MKTLSLGAELLHADGQTDRHEEARSRFSQFCERDYKERQTFVTFGVERRNKSLLQDTRLERSGAGGGVRE